MPYPKDSPLKDKTIRKMVTAACYAEIALAAGSEWDPTELERVIDGKEYGSFTGRYRRLFRGIVPKDDNANQLLVRFDNKCQISKWRDHPFWKLLSLRDLTHRDIELALLSVTSEVNHHIWMWGPTNDEMSDIRFIRGFPWREQIEDIASYRDFDALVTLVAYAREGRDSGMIQEYIKAARGCLDIFPSVVTKQPHLYICWKLLAKRLKSLLWKPKFSFVIEPDFSKDLSKLNKKVERLAKTARRKGVQLPPEEVLKQFN